MRSTIGTSTPAVVILALAAALAAWLAAAGAVSAQPGPDTAGWAPADGLAGVDAPGAQWITVAGPDGHTLPAAVFRPPGPGPWPVVVVLPGAAGLPEEVLPLARSAADAGFLTVAGCWHAGGPPGPTPARYVGCYDGRADPGATGAVDPRTTSRVGTICRPPGAGAPPGVAPAMRCSRTRTARVPTVSFSCRTRVSGGWV